MEHKKRCKNCCVLKDGFEFIRKDKIWGSCNRCSETYKKKYQENRDVMKAKCNERNNSLTDEQKIKKQEYQQLYYEDRKKEIAEKNKEKNGMPYECECGCVITFNNKNRHMKTEKHKALMKFIDAMEEQLKKVEHLNLDEVD